MELCDCGAQEASPRDTAVLSHLGISPDSPHPWDGFSVVPIAFTCEIGAHYLWSFRKGTVVPVTATKDISSKTPF